MADLDQKIIEYESLPANILGIDGWLLRAIPKRDRAIFLKEHLRTITATFHPDKTADPKEKERRTKYIGSVANAVSFLISDSYAFDLAVEEIPTIRNPLVKFKRDLESSQSEVAKLSSALQNQENQYSALKKERDQLQENLGANIEKLDFANKNLKKREELLHLQEYTSWQFQNQPIYMVNREDRLLIEGKKIGVVKTIRNQSTSELIRQTCLLDLARKRFNDNGDRHNFFTKNVSSDLLYSEKETIFFEQGESVKGRMYTKLIGSMSGPAISAYISLNNIDFSLEGKSKDSFSSLGSAHHRLLFSGDEGSAEHLKYLNKISSFTLPYASPDTPMLVERSFNSSVRFELIYPVSITKLPAGTEVDLWFQAPNRAK